MNNIAYVAVCTFFNKDERLIFHEIAHITLRVRHMCMIVSCKNNRKSAKHIKKLINLARVNIKTDYDRKNNYIEIDQHLSSTLMEYAMSFFLE